MEGKFQVTTQSKYIKNLRFKNETKDCVVTSIAIACEIDYPIAHELIKNKMGRKDRKGTYSTKFYLDGWVADGYIPDLNKPIIGINNLHNPKYKKPTYYTVKTFAETYNKGNYLLLVCKHALAVVDGVIYDHSSFKNNNRRPILSAYKIEN